jgi:BirA family transcriptional regulator, biotin operon repressor / biotin---[acetyl-CoA-carboxylase] ligase
MPGSVALARRELFDELPSTQDRAIELARDGAEDGSVVVARRQSRGRGRGERRWESPRGGLYLSLVLRPAPAGTVLPLAIGAEVAGALSMEFPVRLRLKWPNDVLAVDGAGDARKLAGVLVDLVRAAGGGAAAVVGIGVNARHGVAEMPAEVATGAVSLEELCGRAVDLDRLESIVAGAAVATRRALAEPNGDRSELERVRGLLYGVGERVTVDGKPVGSLVGVRDDGALEVAAPDGLRALLAGEVRVGVGR